MLLLLTRYGIVIVVLQGVRAREGQIIKRVCVQLNRQKLHKMQANKLFIIYQQSNLNFTWFRLNIFTMDFGFMRENGNPAKSRIRYRILNGYGILAIECKYLGVIRQMTVIFIQF